MDIDTYLASTPIRRVRSSEGLFEYLTSYEKFWANEVVFSSNPWVDITHLEYGAKPGIDSTEAIQKAINRVPAGSGSEIRVPSGSFSFSNLVISGNKSITLRGAGMTMSKLLTTQGTGNVIEVNLASPNRFVMKDITLGTANGGNRTSGYGLHLTGANANSWCEAPLLKRVDIRNCSNGVFFENCSAFNLRNSFFSHHANHITIASPLNPDGGDSWIVNNRVEGGPANYNGIVHYSGGGLFVLGNKLMGASNGFAGYLLSLDGGSTGIVFVQGTSSEAWKYHVYLQKQVSNSGYYFQRLNIQDNQFDLTSDGGVGVYQVEGSSWWLDELIITGNIFNQPANTSGIFALDAGSGLIADNQFHGVSDRNLAMYLGVNCTNMTVGLNAYSNITSHIINNSPSTRIHPQIYYTEPPTDANDYHNKGEIWFNSNVAEEGANGSKYVTSGWICTANGTPGTWLPMRSLTGN